MISKQKIFIVIVLISIGLNFTSQYFLTFENFVTIFLAMSIEGTIAIGMTYVIIAGEIDLSVGATMSIASVFAILFQTFGIIPGVLAGIGIGTVVGFLNGVIVTRLKAASISTTIGMMVFLTGVVFVLTGKNSIRGTNEGFALITTPEVASIPIMVIIFLVINV